MILEDILENIASNNGVVTDVSVQDSFAQITYLDSSGTQHVDKYNIVINDDGSEDWVQVT